MSISLSQKGTLDKHLYFTVDQIYISIAALWNTYKAFIVIKSTLRKKIISIWLYKKMAFF